MSTNPGRKPNSNAVLKMLPDDRQDVIAAWCAKANDLDEEKEPIPGTGGLEHARRQLLADGIDVSLKTLSVFYSWWRRRQRFRETLDRSAHIRELMAQFRPGDDKLAREFADYLLMTEAADTRDPELIATAAKIHDNRRTLELNEASAETKRNFKREEIDLRREAVTLDRQKWEFDAASAVLANAAALKSIAQDRSLSSEGKIEQVRLKLWGSAAARPAAPDVKSTEGAA